MDMWNRKDILPYFPPFYPFFTSCFSSAALQLFLCFYPPFMALPALILAPTHSQLAQLLLLWSIAWKYGATLPFFPPTHMCYFLWPWYFFIFVYIYSGHSELIAPLPAMVRYLRTVRALSTRDMSVEYTVLYGRIWPMKGIECRWHVRTYNLYST